MSTHDTAANHDHLGRTHTRNTAHQNTAPAIGLLQRPRSDLRGQTACNLGHRCQQRQAAMGIRYRFIRNRGTARGQQVMGLVRIGRQMQIGEQQLTFAQHLALTCLGFFDLDDHVGGGEDLGGGVDDTRASGDIGVIVKACADPGIGFYQNLMTTGHGLLRGIGGHADAELLRLDLFGAADFHVNTPFLICLNNEHMLAQFL